MRPDWSSITKVIFQLPLRLPDWHISSLNPIKIASILVLNNRIEAANFYSARFISEQLS